MGTAFLDKFAEIPKIAAVGCGSWGQNIVRNLSELGALSAVCDINNDVAQEISRKYGVPARTLGQILDDGSYDGVAVASPAVLHVKHAGAALRAGKHVFVEKPLALTASEGHALAHLARNERRILMVGHLLQYHPLVRKLFDLVHGGHLGEVKHISCNRLHVGRIRKEENVIWSLAPHDISVILAVLGELPRRVSVEASSILDPEIADIASIHMEFGSGLRTQVHVSWLNPYKEQRLTVLGSKASVVFDDGAEWDDRLTIYDRQTKPGNSRPWKKRVDGERVLVARQEPLREECSHFLESILTGNSPRTDAIEALGVLSVLDAATRSLKSGKPESV
ncbi:MAG: Gfo/Idh/MocA family oxidoreductase [Rhizomicrobium sp.]|jgi:predicted dehydrogenase